MVSIDTETNGLDLHHGCKPFLVTSCTDEGETTYWIWDVDPFTREPQIPPGDVREIRDLLARVAGWGKFAEDVRDRHKLVGHNSKFDCAALAAVGVDNWPWEMSEDTLIAGHLLASNQPHDLTAMVYHYLGDTIEPYEKALEEAVKECRRTVQQARLRVKRLREREGPTLDVKVISGGQNGVDQAALRAAKACGLRTGGTAPKGWTTLDGPAPWLGTEFGLEESWATGYPTRTATNVSDADVTLQVYEDPSSAGERCTLNAVDRQRKPLIRVDLRKGWDAEGVRKQLIEGGYEMVNVAGNSETTCYGIGIRAEQFLRQVFSSPETSVDQQGAELARWRIADEGLPEMPSAKGELWRADYWLPRAMVKWLWETSEAYQYLEAPGRDPSQWIALKIQAQRKAGWEYRPPELDGDHPWWTVLSTYANADSASTVALWQVLRKKIADRGLGKIYRERMRCLPVTAAMERRGVTLSKARLEETVTRFREESEQEGRVCVGIAASMGYDLTLPKSGNNKSLVEFAFGTPYAPNLKLPVVVRTDTGGPSLSKPAIEQYLATLPPRSKQLMFVQKLSGKRSRDTADQYMDGYQRYWKPLGDGDTYVLHPNLNQTGTDTLRFSCSNPNTQNISKKEGFTLRYLFGPSPGRVWCSFDYENIELKIPGYKAPEQPMIDLFEKPDEPPYFGSYHLMNASIIYPDLFAPFAGDKGAFKKKYAATWYQWCKNAGFALIYGCQEAKFDATAHKPGAYRLLKEKLPNLFRYADHWIAYANKHGYVETLPDRAVDPVRGYPILCSRTERGGISPTIPLNYHIQSTAMWCTAKAMVRVDEYLAEVSRKTKKPYHMVLQVHDEIVVDMPDVGRANLPVIKEVKRLMELSGEDIGVPLTVAYSYHPETWAAEGKLDA